MAKTKKPGDKVNPRSEQTEQRVVGNSAVRHVGPTLESDPKYLDEIDREGGDRTPEAQIANVGAPADSTMGRSATDISADVSSTDDAAKARRNAGPEPLRTRLPGDTSSDPHTDLGPDNASTVQRRGEGGRE